jgi:hypothetical protein
MALAGVRHKRRLALQINIILIGVKSHNINSIKTLADYYNVKYNDSKWYALLQEYVKAVNSCSFVYSVKDKLLVQATSFGEDIIL